MASSEAQKRLRRSKDSEREFGKYLLQHNGPDPVLQKIASSTGRVGHITDLQFDVVSLDYAGENKRVRLPTTLMGWWDKIVQIAAKHGKQPILRIQPSNAGDHEEMHILEIERIARISDRMHKESAELRAEKEAWDKSGPEWC
jgi:hypothetical protein